MKNVPHGHLPGISFLVVGIECARRTLTAKVSRQRYFPPCGSWTPIWTVTPSTSVIGGCNLENLAVRDVAVGLEDRPCAGLADSIGHGLAGLLKGDRGPFAVPQDQLRLGRLGPRA